MNERTERLISLFDAYPEGYDPKVATDEYLRIAMRRNPILGVTRDKAFFKDELEKSLDELDVKDEEERVVLSNQVKYLFFIMTEKIEGRVEKYNEAVTGIVGRVLARTIIALMHYHEELGRDIHDGAYGDLHIIVATIHYMVLLSDFTVSDAEMFIITALNTCMTLSRAEIDYGDIMEAGLAVSDKLLEDSDYFDNGVIETIVMLNMLAMQHPSVMGNKKRENECVKRVVKCTERQKAAKAN